MLLELMAFTFNSLLNHKSHYQLINRYKKQAPNMN